MNQQSTGPGVLNAADVGSRTIATTTLLSARVIMAYAAGINDTNAVYFDDTRDGGLQVHPGICFRLQWNSRFKIDRKPNLRAAPYGVHASTDLRIHQPFRAGEAITTQGTLVSMQQIPPGVFAVDRYTMTNSDGELVAELDYNGITRGATLDNAGVVRGEVLSQPVPVPRTPAQTPLWESVVPIAPHAAQQYTECAQIYNPIHTEPSIAKAAGLPDIILHGSATQAIALTQVINHVFDADPSRIVRVCGQLRAMVLMNTQLRVQCLGLETRDTQQLVFYQVLNEAGELAIANGVICGQG